MSVSRDHAPSAGSSVLTSGYAISLPEIVTDLRSGLWSRAAGVAEEAADELELLDYERTALRAERDELLEALRFYADPANWQDFIARQAGRDSYYHSAHAHLDKGERARAAIAKALGQ